MCQSFSHAESFPHPLHWPREVPILIREVLHLPHSVEDHHLQDDAHLLETIGIEAILIHIDHDRYHDRDHHPDIEAGQDHTLPGQGRHLEDEVVGGIARAAMAGGDEAQVTAATVAMMTEVGVGAVVEEAEAAVKGKKKVYFFLRITTESRVNREAQ